jgi:two-component system OmpR family response regulator
MKDNAPSNHNGRSILCVEDDLDTCEFMAILLSEFRFEFSHSVKDVLPRIETENHDLYILDNWLPDGSGIDLCRTIRQRHPTTPILFTSGSTKEAEIKDAIIAGADEYLLKPCEPERLKEIVKDLIFRN